jgi:hypothetical protein
MTDDADVPDFPDIDRHQQASWNAMRWGACYHRRADAVKPRPPGEPGR